MEAKSYLMSDNEFATAVGMIVGGVEEKYNYTIVDVTDMDIEDMTDMIEVIDVNMPLEIMQQVEQFRLEADDDASVYVMYAGKPLDVTAEVCGIISVKES